MIDVQGTADEKLAVCGQHCRSWVNWRHSIGNRLVWKCVCTCPFLLYSMWYFSMVDDSISGIFETLKRTALISKSAGGEWFFDLKCFFS